MPAHRFHALPFLLLAAAACAPAEEAPPADVAADAAADQAALQALTEREMAAFTSGDLDAIGTVFAADAMVMPPNEPTVRGVDSIRAWTARMQEMASVSGSYTSMETRIHGDSAYQWMTYELTITPREGGEPIVERGRGVHFLRREPDGSWKVVLDIWNSTATAPGM